VEEQVHISQDQEAEEVVSEDHVLVSFTSANGGNGGGNAFAEGSLVLITPPETVENVAGGIGGGMQGAYYAKVANYNVERKILKLVYEGSRREDYDVYVNDVLKIGSTIACSNGNTCAKVQELDAEWHRGQAWAIHNEFLDKVVRWEVKNEMDCAIGEQDGIVWGWLPANESDYYMQHEPEEKGGKPKPLWRVKFSADIMSCDLDEHELAKALRLYATKHARAAVAAKGTKTKRQLFRAKERGRRESEREGGGLGERENEETGAKDRGQEETAVGGGGGAEREWKRTRVPDAERERERREDGVSGVCGGGSRSDAGEAVVRDGGCMSHEAQDVGGCDGGVTLFGGGGGVHVLREGGGGEVPRSLKLQKLAALNAFRVQQVRRLQIENADMSYKEAVKRSMTAWKNISATDKYGAAHAAVALQKGHLSTQRRNLLNFNCNVKAKCKLGRATGGIHKKKKRKKMSCRGIGSCLSGLRGVT
jgi:hypothetical protein